MNMKRFTTLMHDISGAIMLAGQSLISAFFVIIILVLVLAVEIQRVAHGIELFESNKTLAYGGAFVLVMMLLTLEFVVHYIESKTGYEQSRQQHFSLRAVWQWLVYFAGWSDSWQPRLKSPAQKIKSYSRLLTATILALALGGSMSNALASVDGNWIDGIWSIALDSTLIEMVEWAGGLLFAAALVVGSQRLTAYVAQRASETLAATGDSDVHQPNNPVMHDDCTALSHDSAHILQDFAPLPMDDDTDTQGCEPINLLEEELSAMQHTVQCEDCGQTFTHDNLDSAKRALRTHQAQHCKARQRVEAQQ